MKLPAWLPLLLLGIFAGMAVFGDDSSVIQQPPRAAGVEDRGYVGTENAPAVHGGGGAVHIDEPGQVSTTFSRCSRGQKDACVVDGDTFKYQGVTIRIEDIDTPETHRPRCQYEADLGARATTRLKELLNAGPFEVVHDGGRDEDRYGRKLRVVERGGRSLGQVLVDEGLARPWEGRRRSWCE
jgi:endonuclease YncB( thermonuclease family)